MIFHEGLYSLGRGLPSVSHVMRERDVVQLLRTGAKGGRNESGRSVRCKILHHHATEMHSAPALISIGKQSEALRVQLDLT